MHLVMIGGSDAGISAALRARELDPDADVTVVVADAFPNFSICGIPYYVSGEVTHWRNLAHRTIADLEAAGMWLRLDTTARRIDVPARKLLVTDADGKEELLAYDRLVVGTGAGPVRPPITGLDGPGALGPGDGVHLLHSMGDTFAVVRTLETAAPASAVIVGGGYIGLEMADALTVRGLAVTQMEQLPEVLPTIDPPLGALVHAELAAHGVEVLTGTAVQAITRAQPGQPGRLDVQATAATGRLLGMQLFGHKNAEVAKRIDIAATAIFHHMTVDAVSDLDLSYTPPLGSPWEAVQMGAQAWVRHSGPARTP
jgi:NADPH-dependent 2,4-dienoyl-CoA reductase/sulfur reductase-like enzyme